MSAPLRAYQELRGKGQPDRFAFEAALTVYLWHHPLVPIVEAGKIVPSLIRASPIQDDPIH
jgi:hypothetical protein